MDIGLGVEFAAPIEGQQVERGKVAGGIIEEHVFRARVRAADRPVLGAGVPGVHRVMELDARIGAGPGGMADLIPQRARLHDLGHRAIGAAQQLPVRVVLHRLEESIGDAHRIVRILPRDRDIGIRIPIGVIGRKFDRAEPLPRILQHAVDVGFRDHRLFRGPDRGLQPRVHRRIGAAILGAIESPDRLEDLVQLALVHLGTGHQRGDLLFFDDLPVDEFLDIGVIHVADHHLGGAARGAARFDRPRRAVADLQEPHQAAGLAAARQPLALGAQAGKVGAGARAVFEQTRFADPEIHDAALAHQIVADGLDETGMRLRMFIGRGRFRQLAGLVIDIVMALRRAVDAIGPVQAGVEPLRAVGRGHLRGQHVAQLVVIGAGVVFIGEIAALPAPIGPGPGHPVEHLLGRGFADKALIFGQSFQHIGIGHGAPQEFGHALFLDALERRRNARLAEVFLRDHVRGDLAEALGHFHGLVTEHHLAIGIADFRGGGGEAHRPVGAALDRGELALDLHLPVLPFPFLAPTRQAEAKRPTRRPRPEAGSNPDGRTILVGCLAAAEHYIW